MNPYIQDILSQPEALYTAVENYSTSRLENINLTEFDRIIISGMGSSYYAAYPAFVELSKQAVPVQLVNAAELLHFLRGMIGSRSLLWLNSQSGRSAEMVNILERIKSQPPASILSFVNDVSSPMAKQADLFMPIYAGEEATVSTKTYVNMLAVNLLAALQLTSGALGRVYSEIRAAAHGMELYLRDWEAHVQQLNLLLGDFDQLFLIGRGTSMSAVWNGSLINKEAAKCAFEGIHSADFRHGPLEIVSERFAALIFAGSRQTSMLNRDLAREIIRYRGNAIWLDSTPDPELPTILLPETSELTRPLVEILPMQMLTLAMAGRKQIEAGTFRHISKITDRE